MATQLVPAPELNAALAGKPAFFDSERGLKWDGQNAFLYAVLPQQYGALPQLSESTQTAVPLVPAVGNGTEGNLEDHRQGVHSNYLAAGF